MLSSLPEARTIIEAWRQHYNKQRPHGSLGWLTPIEFKARPYNDRFKIRKGGSASVNTATSTPYAYDWGAEFPTQIVFYDEMRYGSSREQVDVRMIEARGGRPVD